MAKKSPILENLPLVLKTVGAECRAWTPPLAGTFVTAPNPEFRILISTVLSLRTKDRTTEEASRRLFNLADTPRAMLGLPLSRIEKLIYPVGFFRTKAKNIHAICRLLLERHGGRVPDTLEELLALPGVGRKTANLVITVGYNKPGICVDTHVHRISNRWGLVKTKSPEETEMALRASLPEKYWIPFNDLLVCYGQNLCVPVSPFCARCKISHLCPRKGVTTHR
ncbi:MAG TPA: endonuclease III [Candidatus Eisenbacteria bacterium]|jgi:endonuclease-3|nr:endonuclease III [Candidatus Eisenbacteria bacterium]